MLTYSLGCSYHDSTDPGQFVRALKSKDHPFKNAISHPPQIYFPKTKKRAHVQVGPRHCNVLSDSKSKAICLQTVLSGVFGHTTNALVNSEQSHYVGPTANAVTVK